MGVLWAISFWVFALLLLATFFSSTPQSAILIISLCGFSWGATQWIPFTLMGEYVSSVGIQNGGYQDVESQNTPPQGSSAASATSSDTSELLDKRNPSFHDPERQSLDAGLVLGIHNIYIVLPQFLSTFLSSLIFMYTGWLKDKGHPGLDEFGWVLRIGGFASVVAGFYALRVEEITSPWKRGD